MRVTFLGTGTSQGIPVIACQCEVCRSNDDKDHRLRSAVLIQDRSNTFVIDSGPDFRQQMLRADVRKLDAVLLTHGHKDHTGGLDDVRSFNYLQQAAMPVYGREEVLEDIRREFSYAFGIEKYPGVPQLELHPINEAVFEVSDVLIQALPVLHGKMNVSGFRIGQFSYITDASFVPDRTIQLIKNSDVLVINALRLKKHYSHFNLEEALELIHQVKPKKAYLTHIGHMMGRTVEVEKLLPPDVSLAYDGLVLNL